MDYLRTEQAAVIQDLQSKHDNIAFFNGSDVTNVGSLSDDVHLNDLGAEQVAYRLIRHLQTPNEAPTVSFSVLPENPKLGEVVTISWSVNDTDGIIRSTIKITVTDNRGSITIKEVQVVVEDEATNLTSGNNLEFSIYPNPSHDVIYLSGVSVGSSYEIFDINGGFCSNGLYSDQGISVKKLSVGIYVVKVKKRSIKLIVE